MNIPWENLVVAGVTAIGMWIIGWIRVYLAGRVSVSSPVARKVRRLSLTVKKHSLLFDAVTDKLAMLSQGIIILANAVKLGDQKQVDKALDVMTAAENQFMAFLTSHVKDEEEDDEEE